MKKGFTILEIVIAVSILAVGILPVMSIFGRSSKMTSHTDYTKIAAYTIENLLNNMLNNSSITDIPDSNNQLLNDSHFQKYFPEYELRPIKGNDDDIIKYYFTKSMYDDTQLGFARFDETELKFVKESVDIEYYNLTIRAEFKNAFTGKIKIIELEAFKGNYQ